MLIVTLIIALYCLTEEQLCIYILVPADHVLFYRQRVKRKEERRNISVHNTHRCTSICFFFGPYT